MTDTEISRYMALLLRHKPEIAGLVLDKQGWADVGMLLKCISENMEPVSFERLCEIVKNDSKQRYSFSEDKSRIRANQGHSVNVDVGLKAAVPPEYLYHGTATRFVESIDRGGIIRNKALRSSVKGYRNRNAGWYATRQAVYIPCKERRDGKGRICVLSV